MKVFRTVSRLLGVACAVSGVVLLSAGARADSVIYTLDYTFSGTPPSGAAPWVDVNLQDVNPGTVTLTISNVNLTGQEFNVDVYLNFNPAKNVSQLSFGYESGSSGLSDLSTSNVANFFKADGDGYYDIDVGFATANDGRFMGGDYITYQITGITNLVASDFEFPSEMGGGAGEYYAAAKIQGISSGLSGWIGSTQPVPEPGFAAFLVLAGGVCWWMRRLVK